MLPAEKARHCCSAQTPAEILVEEELTQPWSLPQKEWMRRYSGGPVSPKIFWDRNWRKDASLSAVEGSGTPTPTAQPAYLKCSSYVYSACPEQPAVHAGLFQPRFQNSCKTVLFSWNVQEKAESSHGREYMTSRHTAKNSYTEIWVPSSTSLEPRTEIRKSLWSEEQQSNRNR